MDKERLFEFYEWDSSDGFEHVKKIPLVRINSVDMENIINGNIKVNKLFLDKISNKTILYKNKKYIKYGVLFSDLNRVVAIEFDNEGFILSKSSLLLDEEEDVISDAFLLSTYNLEYKVIDKYDVNNFLTRSEVFKKNYLLKELLNIYKENYFDKLNYLYEEVFGKDHRSIDEKYDVMIKDINDNYNDNYNRLYDIVRLSYQKK